MYSLDVNFLRDRKLTDDSSLITSKPGSPIYLGDKAPLAFGLAALVLFPAIAYGSLLYFKAQEVKVQEDIVELEAQIRDANLQKQSVEELREELNQAQAETDALVSVFTQIKPWSAILQDLSDRVPQSANIESLEQEGSKITIQGSAATYDDVNDFLLTLQQSQFVKPNETYIASATSEEFMIRDVTEELVQESARKSGTQLPAGYRSWSDYLERQGVPKLSEFIYNPVIVKYSIVTSLNDIPAAQITDYLSAKGADGLVQRINTLKETGAIKR